jgi:trigger factor
LSFHDGRIDGFDTLMKGVKAGDKKTAEVEISEGAANEQLRGKKAQVELEVLDVKKLELPELDAEFLKTLGDFEGEQELRDTVRRSLERRLKYHQQQRAREQILGALTVAADWDLPPEMLERQSGREFERAVLELRRSGFSDNEIRAHANELMQNSKQSTAKALKEHFVLEKLAETEKIEAEPADYDDEIKLIAEQSGESVRRVRAQIEKRGLMDILQNQIVERKVLEKVQSEAKFKDKPYEPGKSTVEAISVAAGGDAEAVPAATEAEESKKDKA